MFEVTNGKIYRFRAATPEEGFQAASNFFRSGDHENDVVALDGISGDPIYASQWNIAARTLSDDCFLHFTRRIFKDARKNNYIMQGAVVPVLNAFEEPICLLRRTPSTLFVYDYEHFNQPPDTRVFSLYDTVVLTGVTEAAFILLKDALVDYPGRVICAGTGWNVFRQLFPDRPRVEYVPDAEHLPGEVRDGKTMYLKEFVSAMAGWEERSQAGIFSYDEIMTLVYCFAVRRSYGPSNPDKKFLLVDPFFETEGLVSICGKVQQFCVYGEAQGFVPVIRLTHSDQSHYSDAPSDDIWGKFFQQPYGKETDGWEHSQNVWEMPLGHASFAQCWLMEKLVGRKVSGDRFSNTNYLNDRVREEINNARELALPHPERTIGVLIRGTDYTSTHVTGHSKMATPDQVMEKIKEWEATGKYGEIFLATEDEDILEKMKVLCGDRLHFIDQRRFRIRSGELLFEQKKERESDGWLRGKEYLTALQLLSECKAFIASGSCGGTSCVLNTAGDRFEDVFVFDLGRY